MQMALQEAEKAYNKGEVPVGAVVVLNGAVIGRGHNLRETLQDSSAHAEMIALREAAHYLGSWRLIGATLYTTLEPCPMCAGALVQFRVKQLVYGAADAKSGAVDSIIDVVRQPKFNHRLEVLSGIMEEECRAILQRFFRELRSN
ncbi:MAG: tRNA adenosine(34) deaminase TadA [Peptococcaceae bacterium]|nr:tRNA adenosine(34) deaminase TadA [Peptococcaceae bacterium]